MGIFILSHEYSRNIPLKKQLKLQQLVKKKYCCCSRTDFGILLVVCRLMQIHVSGSEKKRPETMQGCFGLPDLSICSRTRASAFFVKERTRASACSIGQNHQSCRTEVQALSSI
jgi:hypothetical protein